MLHGLADMVRPLGLTAGDAGELVLALMAAVDKHREIDAAIDEVVELVQSGELTAVIGEPMVEYVDLAAARTALIWMVNIARAEAVTERQVKLGEAVVEPGRMLPILPSMDVIDGDVWVAAMPGTLRVFNAVEQVQFETETFEIHLEPHPVYGVPESSPKIALVPEPALPTNPIIVLSGPNNRDWVVDHLKRWGCQ